MTRVPTEAEIEAALEAFNAVVNAPQMVPCPKCEGRGYHHGFGEDGASPDWCTDCGGNQYNVVPGEELRAMTAALTSAYALRSSEGEVAKLVPPVWRSVANDPPVAVSALARFFDNELGEWVYTVFDPGPVKLSMGTPYSEWIPLDTFNRPLYAAPPPSDRNDAPAAQTLEAMLSPLRAERQMVNEPFKTLAAEKVEALERAIRALKSKANDGVQG